MQIDLPDLVLPRQLQQVAEVAEVDARDDRAHGAAQAGPVQMVEGGDGAGEGVGHVAEVIMEGGDGAVDADADALETTGLELLGSGGIEKPAVAVHGDIESLARGIGGDVEEVGADEGFPSAEVDEGDLLLGEDIDNTQDVRRRQLLADLVAAVAVGAAEVAAIGQSPVEGQRCGKLFGNRISHGVTIPSP